MPHKINLIFVGPCVIIGFTKYNQQDVTFLNLLVHKTLYMFQAVPPPIIRSTNLYVQRQVFVRPMLLPAAIVEEREFHGVPSLPR